MNKDKRNYFPPGDIYILVRKLTIEIIEEAIKAYAADNARWLKLYHFAGDITPSMFDQLQAEHIQELKEIEGLDD